MLALGASVNFYMFHGGTNFGFSAGEFVLVDKYIRAVKVTLTRWDAGTRADRKWPLFQ